MHKLGCFGKSSRIIFKIITGYLNNTGTSPVGFAIAKNNLNIIKSLILNPKNLIMKNLIIGSLVDPNGNGVKKIIGYQEEGGLKRILGEFIK